MANFCYNCGTPITPGCNFCPNCGTALTNDMGFGAVSKPANKVPDVPGASGVGVEAVPTPPVVPTPPSVPVAPEVKAVPPIQPRPDASVDGMAHIHIDYAGNWAAVDCKIRIYINGKIHDEFSFIKGFSTDIYTSDRRVEVVARMSFRKSKLWLDVLPGHTYNLKLTYNRVWGSINLSQDGVGQ